MFAAFVPPGVVTNTLAAPADPAEVVQDSDVAVTPLIEVQAAPPIVAAEAPVRLLPVMVTLVPPSVVPLVGETNVTAGAAT